MKEMIKKLVRGIELIYGYGILICLFGGGMTFFGYLAAIILGGETAAAICSFIYKEIYPILIYMSTSLVILGLIKMYLSGETALTAHKKKK